MRWNSLLTSLVLDEGGVGGYGRDVGVAEDGVGLEVNGFGVRGGDVGIELA